MAWVLVLLHALVRLQKRGLGLFLSVALNNFFLFVALILLGDLSSLQMGGTHPIGGSGPFFLVIGFILLFPLSNDPLRRIPASRLSLWPLSHGQRVLLRALSLVVSPIFWIAILLFAFRVGAASAFLFLLIAMAVQVLSILGIYIFRRLPAIGPSHSMPRMPSRLGGIFSLALKQITTTLDFYLAMIISVAGCIYRCVSPRPDPHAFPILAVFVALALSTYGQQMFGRDSASAISRYRLLPLRGWQILIAKDVSYLGLLIFLVLPLNLGAGLTFGLVALAIGRYTSLRMASRQDKWRFTSGNIWFGFCQIVAGFALAISTVRISLWFLPAAALLYAISVVWGGWLWEKAEFCI